MVSGFSVYSGLGFRFVLAGTTENFNISLMVRIHNCFYGRHTLQPSSPKGTESIPNPKL